MSNLLALSILMVILLLCKGAAIAAALVDQLMADVDSLSMNSIVPGSLRKF